MLLAPRLVGGGDILMFKAGLGSDRLCTQLPEPERVTNHSEPQGPRMQTSGQ